MPTHPRFLFTARPASFLPTVGPRGSTNKLTDRIPSRRPGILRGQDVLVSFQTAYMTVNEAINSCDLGSEPKILAWASVSFEMDYSAKCQSSQCNGPRALWEKKGQELDGHRQRSSEESRAHLAHPEDEQENRRNDQSPENRPGALPQVPVSAQTYCEANGYYRKNIPASPSIFIENQKTTPLSGADQGHYNHQQVSRSSVHQPRRSTTSTCDSLSHNVPSPLRNNPLGPWTVFFVQPAFLGTGGWCLSTEPPVGLVWELKSEPVIAVRALLSQEKVKQGFPADSLPKPPPSLTLFSPF